MEYKQRKANLIADNRKKEYDYAPTPDTEIDNVGMNMNNTKEQIQVTMECPNKEEYQATMGSSPDTNNTEVEMIDPTENDLVTPRNADVRVLDTKDKLVAQHNNSEESTTLIYMQGNEDLRDKLNTLSFTNLAARSNEHVEPHTLETANKATQPGDTEWLHSEGFTPVVNKKLAASKKNKKIEKSRLQEAESRPSQYKKGKGGNPS
ncbi:16640_t:CDS:1, partial [Gigaspora margarita]